MRILVAFALACSLVTPSSAQAQGPGSFTGFGPVCIPGKSPCVTFPQPQPPVGPAPIFPPGYNALNIPGVIVGIAATTVPRFFTSLGYASVIPGAQFFRDGGPAGGIGWVASSPDAGYGNVVYVGLVTAHVSVPFIWEPSIPRLAICADNAHVTSVMATSTGGQRCRVFATGICGCDGNTWNVCTNIGANVRLAMRNAAILAASRAQAAYSAIGVPVVSSDARCLQIGD